MQLITSATPAARDRVRPMLPEGVGALVPDALLDARIGTGTVASEFDRSLSVRIEGEGPPSQRAIVPQTSVAAKVLASPAGPAFERLVRQTMAVGDAAQGRENLRSITLLPDEHAAKATGLLTLATRLAEDAGKPLQLSQSGLPADERAAAKDLSKQFAAEMRETVSHALAWNADGDITVAPDVSRRLLATLGAYKLDAKDKLAEAPSEHREAILRDDWDTLLHEAHHSVTPARHDSSEVTNVFEEAIPSVLGRRGRSQAAAAAGADIKATAQDPARGEDTGGLGWTGWNRSHLQAQTKEQQERTHAVYVDGPQVVRELLNLAGIDRRTSDGNARAAEILQGRAAEHVPRRIADELIQARGLTLDAKGRERLVAGVKRSVSHADGSAHVAQLLEELAKG